MGTFFGDQNNSNFDRVVSNVGARGSIAKAAPPVARREKEIMDYATDNKWLNLLNRLQLTEAIVDEKGVQIDPIKISDLSLLENSAITVPKKIDLYEDLDITEKDKIFVVLERVRFYDTVLFVNGEDNIVGTFKLKQYLEDEKIKNLLVASSGYLDYSNHNSTKYFFVFADVNMKLYKVPIEVSCQKAETASTHLCIDFGTSNTTVGCFLDKHYVANVSNIAIINGNITLDTENIVRFMSKEKQNRTDKLDSICFHDLVPTVVYIEDCKDPQNVEYLFGYDATRRIKDDNYCPQASCFMEIKKWTSNIGLTEDIQDSNGNKATVSRKEIIERYLLFVIRAAENQFKCKFKNIHISVPVKLKDKVLGIYEDILSCNGYVLEQEHAIDEGIAVLYSIINNQIKENHYKNGQDEKALIIDCGGGTSDLASCKYKIEKDEDGIINLDIATEYMNGDVNFGGNNLTYRIMQYMKVVYVNQLADKTRRTNIDDLIKQDTNSIFSFIEGEEENDDDVKVKERYEEVYRKLNEEYMKAESYIPTRFKEYENKTRDIYEKVKNNFYFLWKLAEEMKKEFYRSTSISRYTFDRESVANRDIDLHINRIENWRLSTVKDGDLVEQTYPEITFTAKEIDKLLRADIYYLVRKFLNGLYMEKTLDTYSQIKLSGQSSKINIFMDSLKEFLPGKKIKSGRINSKGNDAVELKLLCLRGAVMYLHALEKSNIEVELKNETKNIPISVYIRNENAEEKEMFRQGSDWEQIATKRRITTAGKEVYLYMKNVDKEIGEPYKYVYENIQYKQTKYDELQRLSGNRIKQEDIDNLPETKKYIFVFLNQEKWGFDIVPIYRDKGGLLYRGAVEFCSFEMDILQETFFDGRK